MKNTKPVAEFLKFRDTVDRLAAKLESRFAEHLVCGKGCYSCCVSLSVFPVEYYAILKDLDDSGRLKGLYWHFEAACGLLDREGGCQIYPSRPVICRTHGLPVAFLDPEREEEGYFVDFCNRNFLSCDVDSLRWDEESVINLEELNRSLTRLNSRFLRETGYRGPVRIPLRNLVFESAIADKLS